MTLPGLLGLAAAAIVLGSLAGHGFSDNGFRLASRNAWRFASLVFFAAIIVGPLGRLVPQLSRLQNGFRPLGWGFCASYGIYLIAMLVPNAFGARILAQDDSDGITLFVLFGACVIVAMAIALSPRMTRRTGEATRRAVLGVSIVYFWLCYALMGLAHLSHPHRPDAFYGFSLCLMLAALLLRFSDRLASQLRRPLV